MISTRSVAATAMLASLIASGAGAQTPAGRQPGASGSVDKPDRPGSVEEQGGKPDTPGKSGETGKKGGTR